MDPLDEDGCTGLTALAEFGLEDRLFEKKINERFVHTPNNIYFDVLEEAAAEEPLIV